MTADKPTEIVLATRALTRRFGRVCAVDRISLEVHAGDLFGFLGPNGAGKTTTIRMLLGLLRPTSGEIELFGAPLRRNRLRLLAEVGALVEEPAFYPWLSGRENLRVFALAAGGVDAARIDEVLEQVELLARADEPVRVYSQGMRQRLGIAQALLTRPRLVFLDEPTNGLDPEGIEQIRSLLVRLSRERATTVFVSSHLLHEVERMCNRVAILHRGRLVVQGEVEALLSARGIRLELEVDDPARALAVLAPLAIEVIDRDPARARLVIACRRAQVPEINRALVQAGIGVGALVPRRPSLEEFFREQLELPLDRAPQGEPAAHAGVGEAAS